MSAATRRRARAFRLACLTFLAMAAGIAGAREFDTNRNGSDQGHFRPGEPDWGARARACDADARCRSRTCVKPGVHGAQARGFPKHDVLPAQANSCRMPGEKGAAGTPRPAGHPGCSSDQGGPNGLAGRDVDGFMFHDPGMTPGRHVAAWRERGFPHAGVQYATCCFRGSRDGRFGPAGNCGMRCGGDATRVCGGNRANSVYAAGGGCLPRSRRDQVGGSRTTGWQYNHTGRFCGHGEPACRARAGRQSPRGRYADGAVITVTPFWRGGDCTTRRQPRCASEPP